MNTSWLNTGLILGCGGPNPGLRFMAGAVDAAANEQVLPMPASVYAIDIDPVRGLAACATRAGTIHLLRFAGLDENEPPREIHRLVHGRPVVSVCWAGPGGLLSADDSGQVLYWRQEREFTPEPWLTNGPLVCSLNAEAEPSVVGLGAAGQLLVWDTRTGKLITQQMGPPPALPLGLTRLVSWAPSGPIMAVYPARDGQLAVMGVDPPQLRVCPAHQGRWYAAFQIEDRLVTIGHDDATAKLWRWSNDGPVCETDLPALPGVLDAEWIPHWEPLSGVAVLTAGGAVGFTLNRQGLQASGKVPGSDYRVVAAAGEHRRRLAASDQAAHRATELQQQIAASIESGGSDGIDEALAELEALGHGLASLNLQVQRASRTGDELAALRALHQLAAEGSAQDPPMEPSLLERYLDLLPRFGQLELAVDVRNRMLQNHPELRETLDIGGLQRVAEALQAEVTFVHVMTDGPEQVQKAIEAAHILGSPLKGLWELHRSPAILLPDMELNPERLAEALRAGGENGREDQVGAVVQSMLWIRDRDCEKTVSVLLPAFDGPRGESVRIALRVAMQPAGTAVMRSILVDRSVKGPGGSDESLLGLAAQLQDPPARAALLTSVNDWVLTTLRRMRGAALALTLNPLGGVA